MLDLIIGLTLAGHLDNREGCIGAICSHSSHGISRIIPNSPADTYGLKVGDIILEGYKDLKGEPYVYVHVKIKRGSEVFERDVLRLAVDEVYSRPIKQYKVLINE